MNRCTETRYNHVGTETFSSLPPRGKYVAFREAFTPPPQLIIKQLRVLYPFHHCRQCLSVVEDNRNPFVFCKGFLTTFGMTYNAIPLLWRG